MAARQLLAGIVLVLLSLTARAADQDCLHKVKAGDTLNAVASFYGTDLAGIVTLNPGADAAILQIGQELKVPCPDPGVCLYTVSTGDTLDALADTYGTELDAIEELNPGIEPAKLSVGQALKLPCNGTLVAVGGEDRPCTFAIKAGITLAAIAKAYGLLVANIEALNPGIDATKLQIGQVIIVPCDNPTYCVYSLQQGDTLAALAAVLDTDVKTIQSINSGLSPTNLQIGQPIWLPCPCIYTVQLGDDGAKVIAAHATTQQKMEQLNPGLDLAKLQVGQIISVPCNSTSSAPGGSSRKLRL